MEEESATDMTDRLRDKIVKLTGLVGSEDSCREKERRQFPTKLISCTTLDGLRDSRTVSAPTPGAPLHNHDEVVAEVKELLMRVGRDQQHAVRAKPSMKLNTEDSRKHIFDWVRDSIRDATPGERIPSIANLCNRWHRNSDFATATGGSVRTSPYFRDMFRILEDPGIPTTRTWQEFRLKWPLPVPMRLGATLKLSTGEARAFAKDKDFLRSTIGSILQALLSPRIFGSENYPPYNSASPLKTKHLVDEAFEIKSGNSLSIVLGDVSSFTASFKNMWSVLYAVSIDLEDSEEDQLIVVDIGGSLFEITLQEVIRLFLFLGFGAVVVDGNEKFQSIGGMLGMPGVDGLAKSVFALMLSKACRDHVGLVGIYAYLGGDDYRISVDCKSTKPELVFWFTDYIHKYISNFVGKNKDLTVQTIPPGAVDIILDGLYCKKQIRVKASVTADGRQTIRMASQWNLPIMERMIEALIEHRWDDARIIWDTLHSATPWVPEKEVIMDRMWATYVALGGYGDVSPYVNEKTRDTQGIDVMPSGYTMKAQQALEMIPISRDSKGRAWKVPLCDRESSLRSGSLIKFRSHSMEMCTALSSEVLPPPAKVYRRTPSRLAEPFDGVVTAVLRLRERLDLH
jgi:hypothetical protein